MEILYLRLRGYKYMSLVLETPNTLRRLRYWLGLHPRPEARSSSSTSTCIGTNVGAKGLGAEPSPNVTQFFRGFLIADSWESQGNPPSTPAPVIRPSMCQSSPTRWQARDDMTIARSPLFAAWTSQTQENIPVIMAFQCQLACWFWPGTLRLTMERQHVCEPCKVYWERLRFLAHKCSVVLDENLFVEANHQITFTSTKLPKKYHEPVTERSVQKKKESYTSEHTRETWMQTSERFKYWQKIHVLWTKPCESSHFENGLFHFPSVRRESFFWTLTYKHTGKEREREREGGRERERERERAAHLTIHWHESEPLKLTNSERKLQFCAFVSICMSKGNWEIVLQCQVLLAVFSLWWDQNHFFTGSERPDQALQLSQPYETLL